jgi:ABC-2 type transport system permease protein
MISRSLFSLIKKEFIQVMRDPSSVLLAVLLPLVLTFIFGSAISLDTNSVKIGIVAEGEQSVERESLISLLSNSKFIEVVDFKRTLKGSYDNLMGGRAKALLIIPQDFNLKIRSENRATINLITDASDVNTAVFVSSYIGEIMNLWVLQYYADRSFKTAGSVEVKTRVWYNQEQKAVYLLSTGAIALVLSMAGTLLTALVVAREWERGTMEYLIATKVTIFEIIMSKIIPYLLLGLLSFLISFFVVILYFNVPFRGSFWLLMVVGSIYLITTTGLGLLISSAMKTQFAASQLSLLASFMPSIMLSGLIYEIESMPFILQMITHIVPARYLVSILRSMFLMGNDYAALIPNLIALTSLSVIIMFFAARKLRKFLD